MLFNNKTYFFKTLYNIFKYNKSMGAFFLTFFVDFKIFVKLGSNYFLFLS
jgi:hypothetical protein